MTRKSIILNVGLSLILLLWSVNSFALNSIIGDIDGFGYSNDTIKSEKYKCQNSYNAPSYDCRDMSDLHGVNYTQNVSGTNKYGFNPIPADRNGNGILNPGDVLPDIGGPAGPRSPDFKLNLWDWFDHRSDEEKGAENGARFTDVGLSDNNPAVPKVGEAVFMFTFDAAHDPDAGQPHYVTIIYADYDVGTMKAKIDGGETIEFTRSQEENVNGFIGVAFGKIDDWDRYLADGSLIVEFIEDPNDPEPYMAFDALIVARRPSIAPVIGVAKRVVSPPVDKGNGTYVVTYEILVENLGTVPLSNVQVLENLSDTFADGSWFKVVNVDSPDFELNWPGFDGSGDAKLLKGADTLTANEQGLIELTVEVRPNQMNTVYNNTAVGSATGPFGDETTDQSDDGIEPDRNGNGNPDEPGENDPTPVTFPFAETPVIGVAKDAVSIESIEAGKYSVVYQIRVENLGNVVLNNVQVQENLKDTFGDSTFIVTALSSNDFTVNFPGFDGDNTPEMLTGSDTLLVGEMGMIQLTVEIEPDGFDKTYNNTAVGSAIPPSGGDRIFDDSTDGVAPDPNGDKNPDEDEPTKVSFPPTPVIGVTKRVVSPPVDNGDGSYIVTYEILVENLGTVSLSAVQVQDDLSNTFDDESVFEVLNVSSLDFERNWPGFNGNSNTNLLKGTDMLAAGEKGLIELIVKVTPKTMGIEYNNIAVGSGTDASGNEVFDDSEASVEFPPVENPVIGVAKDAVSIESIGAGKYTVVYQIRVENLGDVPLANVQVVENLSDTFDDGSAFKVMKVGSLRFKVNWPGFDGKDHGDTNLLEEGTNTLAVGEKGLIELTVEVTPNRKDDPDNPYKNTAVGSGISPSNVQVEDDSTDGIEPDPNGDGAPDENEPTPVSFTTPVSDSDGDGVPDDQDAFPFDSNEWNDNDNDGTGDNEDPDDDNDGVDDVDDTFPFDPNEWNDNDNDGIGDNADPNDDNDDVDDVNDAFPLDPTETQDSDGDRVGDNSDICPYDPNDACGNDNDDSSTAPIPEPGTFLLLGAGLIGILTLRRRKRK